MQMIKTVIQRHPVVTYFGIAYIIPALSFLVIVLPIGANPRFCEPL